MSAEEKKRKIIENELKKLGIQDKEVLEKLIDEIDTFAKLIIQAYKASKLKNERHNLL